MFFRRMFMLRGPQGPELLDQPLSNYDVLGVPTGAWSSGFCDCFSNIVPSCVLSFFCPCILWSQIVVRAQIPLLISLKNTLQMLRNNSGYGAFVEYFLWSTVLSVALIVILCTLYYSMPSIVRMLVFIILIAVAGALLSLLAHTRTAFRDKYQLPGSLPLKGAGFWERLVDIGLVLFCLPCALSQMARHVFQYEKMDTEVGLFLGDPSTLPPLRPTPEQTAAGGADGSFERPVTADTAGLNNSTGHGRMNTGAAHRQQAIERRQREEMVRDAATPTTAAYAHANAPPAVPVATVVR